MSLADSITLAEEDKKFLKELEDDLIYYWDSYYSSEIDGVLEFVSDYIKKIREE